MYSFRDFKCAPAGPHPFVSAIEIDCPAEQVFPLIDPADPCYSKRQLGESVEPLEGPDEGWRLILSAMPDVAFDLTGFERVPSAEIAFACLATPLVGRLAVSHERYRLEPLGPGACRLELVNTVTFVGPLDAEEWGMEEMLMTMAGHNAVAKLKVHAEQGLDALRAANEQLVVGLDLDWDCELDFEFEEDDEDDDR